MEELVMKRQISEKQVDQIKNAKLKSFYFVTFVVDSHERLINCIKFRNYN